MKERREKVKRGHKVLMNSKHQTSHAFPFPASISLTPFFTTTLNYLQTMGFTRTDSSPGTLQGL